jgi:rubrerythrin
MIDQALLEVLNEKPNKKAKKFIERWNAFSGKVAQRSKDIMEEADEGVDEIIEMNPVDSGPISAALNAVKSRFLSLGSKVDSALEKIEREWDETFDNMKLKGKEEKALRKLWDQVYKEKEKLRHKIEFAGEQTEVKKGADWARVLLKLAQHEAKKPINCPQCGGVFENKLRWATVNEQCPNCDSVNEIFQSTASGLFFSGLGIHSLAQEASFTLWKAMEKEEERFHNKGTKKDHEAAVVAYWTSYYEFTKDNHPGFNKTVEEMVDAKLAHYRSYLWVK